MPATLDILRHGHALPESADGDDARRLSPEGRAAIERLRDALARDGWAPARILASPLARAQETARIVARAAGATVAVETLDLLRPDGDPDAVIAAAAALADAHVVLVAHQPLLGHVVARLAGADIALRPGTFVRLACDDGVRAGGARVVHVLEPR